MRDVHVVHIGSVFHYIVASLSSVCKVHIDSIVARGTELVESASRVLREQRFHSRIILHNT